jgi:hypothetical protein
MDTESVRARVPDAYQQSPDAVVELVGTLVSAVASPLESLAARDGSDIGLSDAQAWSAWRTPISQPAIATVAAQPPMCLRMDALARLEEVMSPTL